MTGNVDTEICGSGGYREYLSELERIRQERVKLECKTGSHSWQHFHSYASCSLCGEEMDMPTPSDYRNDC